MWDNKLYGFWIEPNGIIHTIMGMFCHKEFIERTLNKHYDSYEEATTDTLDNGWIRVVNGDKSLMVDYRYIMSNNQLKALKSIEEQMLQNGYQHKDFILTYGLEYYIFDSMKDLINRIKVRSCNGR